jgi:hypothetical protein
MSDMAYRTDQISAWRDAGLALDIEVIAPCKLALSDGSALEATALVKVGPPNGVVVDPDWDVLQPHADRLVADGYGFSAVTLDGGTEGLVDMLQDWGWQR